MTNGDMIDYFDNEVYKALKQLKEIKDGGDDNALAIQINKQKRFVHTLLEHKKYYEYRLINGIR